MKTMDVVAPIKKETAEKKKRVSGHRFDEAYCELNPEQRLAVDTIEGPVMVVAGPGTGKTQVTALRVANILRQTHMRPGNILCLTFSVSGATAMRERLRALIGPDAYLVTIKNFHSFCHDLIGEYPFVFEKWEALEHVSDVERFRIVNKIIDQLLPDCKLVNKKYPYKKTGEILSRISELKREGVIEREVLEKAAQAFDEIMREKSRPGTASFEINQRRARMFRDFLHIFSRYQEELLRTQRYDYEDMILSVRRALEEEDWLLASLQERYQYILVDEFQDTNGAQYRLVELLTTYPTLDHAPNLFVVGDDDQAIYRFQGANLQNILSFHKRFPSAPIITLTTSYRCSQPILDAAGSLIRENDERLVGKVDGVSKELVSASKKKKGVPTPTPMLLLADNADTEPWLIAELIEERMEKGIAPQEIAVLTQTNADLFLIYDACVLLNIPIHLAGKADLLNNKFVQEVCSVLRAIHNPHDTALLAAALSCSCFDCHPADLGRVFLLNGHERRPLLETLLFLSDAAIEDPASGRHIPFVHPERMLKARDTLLTLHQKIGNRTVVETLEHVFKDCGILPFPDVFIAQSNANNSPTPVDYAALQTFFDRVKQRAYEQPDFSIEKLLLDLKYYAQPEYRDVRMRYELPHLKDHGVQLMTAHQSKGLEFHTVILANFRHGHWDHRRRPTDVSIPEDLLFGLEKEQKLFEHTQDERRVCYVAMTRAKEELLFVAHQTRVVGEQVRDVSPSAFFTEAAGSDSLLPEEKMALKNPERATSLLQPPPLITSEAYRAFLSERLENFALSVTALNHFLEDPKKFLELDLLRMPQAKEASLVFGNAVHAALRAWGAQRMRGQEMNEADVMEKFRAYLREREVLTGIERERLIHHGEELLPRYIGARLLPHQGHVFRVEYPVAAHIGDVPIKGLIDRIDLDAPTSANATVVDYKTGYPKTETQIREGGYFRQLVFYALLLEQQRKLPVRPVSFILDFIGEGDKGPVQRVFTVSDREKKELASVIAAVCEKLQNLDFTPLGNL